MEFNFFNNTKSFEDRWIGHPFLLSRGSHVFRLRLANWLNTYRKTSKPSEQSLLTAAQKQQLGQSGYLIINNFLQPDAFAKLKEEIEVHAKEIEKTSPLNSGEKSGYQPKVTAEFGFDRYDGNTLNRFIDINNDQLPHSASFRTDPRISQLSKSLVGLAPRPSQMWIYQTYHGQGPGQADPQKTFHRDTFFSSMKFWYFITPVTKEDGPFQYVPGSHILSPERLKWEQEKALDAAGLTNNTPDTETIQGSFRISEDELSAMHLSPAKSFTVPGNSFIIADTFGFHRRGDALPGRRRLAIYGNKRPKAFSIFGK